MATRQFLKSDPFIYLFPLGILSAVFGVSVWPLYSFHWLSQYPIETHSSFMYFSFLWSFVCGFLMTAIPKMTQTQSASSREKLMSILLLCSQWTSAVFLGSTQSVVVYSAQIAFLFFFILRRFLQKRTIPFEGMLFLPAAFFMVLLSICLYFFKGLSFSMLVGIAGGAFISNLIFGVGGRLIPAISRTTLPNGPVGTKLKPGYLQTTVYIFWLNLGYFLKFLGFDRLAYGSWLLFILVYSIHKLSVLKKPSALSFNGFGIRIGLIFFLLSFGWGLMGNYQLQISVDHMTYIGGLALITFMVASRVVLAHWIGSLAAETESKIFWNVVPLIAISTLTRALYGELRLSPLLWISIVCFLLGISLWSVKMISLRRNNS